MFYFTPDGDTNYEGVAVFRVTTTIKCYQEPFTSAKVLTNLYRNNLVIVAYQGLDENNVIWGLTPYGWIQMKYVE